MSTSRIKGWTAAVALAGLAAQPLGAAPILGGISFSDGFTSLSSTNTAVVSNLTNINVGASTLAQACTDSFATAGACIPSTGTFASSFVLGDPIATQIVYTYNGFVFTVSNLSGAIVRGGLSCSGGTCTDSLSFDGTGNVASSNPNFTNGLFSMSWMAQGSCTQAGSTAACTAGSSTAFWNARVSALAVPEPTTLALVGLSALLVGFSRRRLIA